MQASVESPESAGKREGEPSRKVRRRYPPELKTELVEKATRPGASVAAIAREHGINANQLFKWIAAARKRAAAGASRDPAPALVPVGVAAPTPAPTGARGAASEPVALEIVLPRATLRFAERWDPVAVAHLLRLLA